MAKSDLINSMARELIVKSEGKVAIKGAFEIAENFYNELDLRKPEKKTLPLNAEWEVVDVSDFNEEYKLSVARFTVSIYEDSQTKKGKDRWFWTVEDSNSGIVFECDEPFTTRAEAEKDMSATILPDLEALVAVLQSMSE